MQEFICTHTYEDGEKARWTGTVTPIRRTATMTEAEISGRGSSFTVIAGSYSGGHFLCIPALDVGCPMAGWDDLLWNRERLSGLMNETDAATVAAGVKALMTERIRTKASGMER